MSDVTADMLADWRAGAEIAVATVVRTSGRTPCPPGTTMALLPDGSVSGSVSGGCVEADVLACLRDVLDGAPASVRRYGLAEDVLAVGLPCGGTIDVLVSAVSRDRTPHLETVVADRAADRPVAAATVVAHPDTARLGETVVVRSADLLGSLGSTELDRALRDKAKRVLDAGRSTAIDLTDAVSVFVDVHPPRPRMLVYGGAAVAAAVTRQATLLGFRVTVCDHRAEFATQRRFPEADEVVVATPADHLAAEIDAGRVDRRTAVCSLTHDVRTDIDLLEVALHADLGYVGAIGSRRVHDDRVRRLRARGVTAPQLATLRSPIGLDIGAQTPAEIAVAVGAEITAVRQAASGLPLSHSA
ncbi:XdhC family protein [Williamsia serinedens]|uniref:Xanthine dehydrogenase accessory factor n=1 Tax=Williamsia serinedens TaxID=391736 RepID=A0ABT1H2R7_9NOCA|nr:XdhC/CoxI family protein [Williamsia serinedens]MCP2160028.1 xanthine dehydrogenase accessory factor [Williamsia serinedens]